MTAWRSLLYSLHATGKPAAFKHEFDNTDYGPAFFAATRRNVALGFMAHAESGRWVLTNLGREHIAGRVTVKAQGANVGRGRSVVCKTWLAALPPTNVVRITSHLQEWAP